MTGHFSHLGNTKFYSTKAIDRFDQKAIFQQMFVVYFVASSYIEPVPL